MQILSNSKCKYITIINLILVLSQVDFERLKSSLTKLCGANTGKSSNDMKSPFPTCYMIFLDMTIYSEILH